MTTLVMPSESKATGIYGTCRWSSFNERPPRAYQCRVVVVSDPDGGFSAHAVDLAGAVSQGESVEEALDNIGEALEGVIAEYIASGPIPWGPVAIDGTPVCEKRILVNV